ANAEYERLASMADGWWQISASWEERDGRVLLYRLGPERFTDRVLLAWTRAPEGAAGRLRRQPATPPARWSAPPLPLNAADCMARGVPKGRGLGAALAAAEEAWIAAGFPEDATAVAAIADAAVASARGCPRDPRPRDSLPAPFGITFRGEAHHEHQPWTRRHRS